MAQAQAQKRIFRTSPHQNNKPEAKKGLLANPGSLIVAALGFTFVGYVFNLGGMATAIDGFLGGMNSSVQSHNSQVSNIFVRGLPLVGMAVIVFIVIAVLRALGPSSRSLAQTEAREVTGIQNFVNAAEEMGVSKKVSRTAYKQLLPFVRKGKYLGLDETLCKDLKIKPDQMSNVYGTLLRHTDRRRTHGDEGKQLQTVLDLMLAVEASEDKSAPAPGVKTFRPAMAPHKASDPMIAVAAPAAVATPAAVAVLATVAVAAPKPVAIEPEAKPKKQGAVMVHPARLDRRELSMIRSRAFWKK